MTTGFGDRVASVGHAFYIVKRMSQHNIIVKFSFLGVGCRLCHHIFRERVCAFSGASLFGEKVGDMKCKMLSDHRSTPNVSRISL